MTASVSTFTQFVPLEVQEKLKQPTKKTLTPEEQWYAIWDLLFPHEQRPSSPYLDTVLGEGIGLVETFWQQQGEEFSAQFLETNQVPGLHPDSLRSLLSEFLGHIRSQLRQETSEGGHDFAPISLEDSAIDMSRPCSSWALPGQPLFSEDPMVMTTDEPDKELILGQNFTDAFDFSEPLSFGAEDPQALSSWNGSGGYLVESMIKTKEESPRI